MLFRKSMLHASISVVAVANVCAAYAQAPASASVQAPGVQVYGVIDVAAGKLAAQPPGPPNAAIRDNSGIQSGGLQTSFLGVRGSRDLPQGIKASFQLEGFFRPDVARAGRYGPTPTQDPVFSRAAWVGLQGGFGDVKVGNVSNPAWLSMVFSSAMGSNSIFSPSFRQQYNGSTRGNNSLDSSLSNTIVYSTPRIGGVVGSLAYQGKKEVVGGDNFVANLVYREGPMLVTLAANKVGHAASPSTPAVKDESLFLIGGSYDFKVVKVFGQYSVLDNGLTKTKHNMPHIGLTAPLLGGELQMAWAQDSARGFVNTSRKTLSVGYVYNLFETTSLYGMATSDKLRIGTANSYVVGVRHAF